jgi:hypothetical protein
VEDHSELSHPFSFFVLVCLLICLCVRSFFLSVPDADCTIFLSTPESDCSDQFKEKRRYEVNGRKGTRRIDRSTACSSMV